MRNYTVRLRAGIHSHEMNVPATDIYAAIEYVCRHGLPTGAEVYGLEAREETANDFLRRHPHLGRPDDEGE